MLMSRSRDEKVLGPIDRVRNFIERRCPLPLWLHSLAMSEVWNRHRSGRMFRDGVMG